MSDFEWGKIVSVAMDKNLKDLRETEVAFNRLLNTLGEEAKDIIFHEFIGLTPQVVRYVAPECGFKLMLIVMGNLSKCLP